MVESTSVGVISETEAGSTPRNGAIRSISARQAGTRLPQSNSDYSSEGFLFLFVLEWATMDRMEVVKRRLCVTGVRGSVFWRQGDSGSANVADGGKTVL